MHCLSCVFNMESRQGMSCRLLFASVMHSPEQRQCLSRS